MISETGGRTAAAGSRSGAVIGQSIPRLEDLRLVRGRGRFVDDVEPPGTLHMHVVRAEVAHARLVSVDVSRAASAPGVVAVVAASDLPAPERIPLRLDFGIPLDPYLQPVLAPDRVRYVGEPVAAVVADSRYAAEDAASLVAVEYEPLPVVLDPVEAAGAPSLWDDAGNEAAVIRKRFGDVEEAFSSAAHVVSAELRVGRHTGVPLETRGLVADWDSGRGELTIWGAALVTHYHRRVVARLLGLSENAIHMRSTDAGGSFGVRGDFFPEDYLVPWFARSLRRPVKWIEDRSEHFVTINHAREQVHRISAAFDSDGVLLGLRDEVWHNKGAYIRPSGVTGSENTLGMMPWPYRVPAFEGVLHVVTTNKTPLGPYRGPGRYENTFVREQLWNIAAEQMGMDPVELRRMNLLADDELPVSPELTVGGERFVLDSGSFRSLLSHGERSADFDSWREEAASLRDAGRLVGCGIGYFMDKSGKGPYETAGIDVAPDGSVRLLIGGASSGQGIETVMAQIAAETLTVPPDRISVVYGDTDLIPDGVGSWSSRSTVIGGSAVLQAAEVTRDEALRLAADALEAATEDLVLADGRVHVVGSPDSGLSLGELAARTGPGATLGAREVWRNPRMNYPYGVALCQLEIDPATGGIEILRYFVAYEVGRAVNPLLLRGQILGGVAQGIGGAILEELDYDEAGQPRSTSLMDYLLPTVFDMPDDVGTLIREDAPTPTNPLGTKGAGESGILGAGAAVAGAVSDALGSASVVTQLPLTPERVLRLVRATARR
jgi:carbon-monoxide dehydrogenase large subunit/6-hydroxypseudooxynicotine dehydrogenase subunit gamma